MILTKKIGTGLSHSKMSASSHSGDTEEIDRAHQEARSQEAVDMMDASLKQAPERVAKKKGRLLLFYLKQF